MPSPVGHSLIGVAITGAFYLPRGRPRDWLAAARKYQTFWIWGILFANLPDIDYVPGLIIGDLNYYHHSYTHTLGWIALVAAGAGLLWKTGQSKIVWKEFAFLFALLASHLLADWLTADGRAPYGIMLAWPFSDAYFLSSHTLFWALFKNNLNEIIQPHNFLAVFMEVAWCVPLFILLALTKYQQEKLI